MALSTPRLSGELLSADAAAARLGVTKATLYAYVSRGLLAAAPDPAEPRRSRYSAFEIDRLRDGHRATGRPAQATPATLYEGHALVETALTGVVDGDIVIRGRRLVPWSRSATLEETAALLWDVRLDPAFAAPAPVMPDLWHRTADEMHRADPVVRAVTLWGLAIPVLSGGVHLHGDALAAALGQHLRVAFGCWLGQAPSTDPLHLQAARAWNLPPRGHEALRQALVLCADVMPNLVGLSSRMLASVQGSLGACMLASLGYGFIRLSGGEFEAVESLFDEVAGVGSLDAVAASYRARGEDLPGFHHPLFLRGDPRATALMALAASLGSEAAAWPRTGPDGAPMHPTLDFGLVALRRALQAPRHAALTITSMARCTGTLAQAIEQRAVGRRMWVQGRYVGPSPDARPPG